MPIAEDHPQSPVNPYGETKLAVEKMLHWYAAAYGLRYAALRYFNAAGADPDGEIGEDHDPETHLIPLAIEAALGGAASSQIFGTDYPTPDGTAIRDYIHVADLADAHLRALAKLRDGATALQLNLGTGRGHSVREVIAAVEKVSGREGAGARGRPARRRSAGAGRRRAPGRRRARLEAALRRARDHRRARLALAARSAERSARDR